MPSSPGDSRSPSYHQGNDQQPLDGPRLHVYHVLKSIGLVTAYNSSIDVKLILAQRLVRVFAYGLVTLILAAYLAALKISETQIGIFFGLTLVGDLVMVMALTQIADAIGRKAILILGAVLMTMSGVVFATSGNYWVLLVAAVFGVISPSATEVGLFKSIEESALFTIVTHDLVDILSWYSTAEFASVTVGLIISGGIMDDLQQTLAWDFVPACRAVFLVYAGVGVVKIVLSSCMSWKIEAWHDTKHQDGTHRDSEQEEVYETAATIPEQAPLLPSEPIPVTPKTSVPAMRAGTSVFSLDQEERLVLLKLCALLAVDSCAVGLSSVPWQTYMVRTRFDVPDAKLGAIFMLGNGLGAVGTLFSSSPARRLGNLITLAVTLLPSAIILLFFGLAFNLPLMLLLIASESFLSPIYLAPRNTFISRILTRSKRTASLGIITMVKLLTNATGSFFTGFWADRDMFWLAFVVAGSLKILYVFGILYAFLAVDRRLAHEQEEREDTGSD
ncbi:hypothetical protein LTR78_006483 [Recurvomyces mirabilis]|uniref:Major facilitator superfamily (MFS) profile domain-containing protein n=1 Tax=Recurvomyces mirabilis TaxID=574656 RepID=A0AAE0WKV4_9PEZI|nr:hypothetical protein LTR78_006483 [Recurvomyces mirabilis]KAK5151098.1 hypothetical protein LTS14_009594 [Recurvomyces mirabilis]